MNVKHLIEQPDVLVSLPVVFSEDAWQQANHLESQALEQMPERLEMMILAAYKAICAHASPEDQDVFDFELRHLVPADHQSEEDWMQLRVAVVGTEGQPTGLLIMLRDEVYEPQLRVPGIFFSPGQIVATRYVDTLIKQDRLDTSIYLSRHLVGDWGDLSDEDKQRNEYALKHGLRLLSAYKTKNLAEKLYIITEEDRSVTTLLLASEY